ncbi:hypothetical protein BDA99DRAFT_542663 [Phascolomyces articulosus]|uniref:Uncharacterized protein n=1 Tax=Phascolomyces articulosus TaxID=60185 RepID=A0AAD5JYV5_9FUNG|nr:hypothetical protein BDA99DRAFT_542663 [Phascolomyces articulosus]
MWYYGALLFSIVLATICSVLIIAKFARQKDIFAGTLDMASRGDASGNTETMIPHRRPIRVGQKTTVIFRKVIFRCICYPLSKGCGVGIEATGTHGSFIPLGVLAADALLGNLIGFFISCIYFTDPAVIAVAREISKRTKRRYVDEYCPVETLLKKPPLPPSSAISFPPISAPSLDQVSMRGSRRLFSADDASTVSKHSSRSDLSIYTSTLSAPSSETSELQFNMNLFHGQQLAQDAVQGRTSVALGVVGNAAAKKRKPADNSPREEIVRSATGRRYTYPHVDIYDPHGRLQDLVNRLSNSARISPSIDSPTSQLPSNTEEEQSPHTYSWFKRTYHVFFPCLVPHNEKDDILFMMPMHIIGGNRSIRRAGGMDTVTMNEMWALNEIQRRQSLRNQNSMAGRVSRSTLSGLHDSRNEQAVQIVECYTHPRLAMLIHWLLIHVFCVKPSNQDRERPLELVNMTAGQATPLVDPIKMPTPIVGRSIDQQQQQLQQLPQHQLTQASSLSSAQTYISDIKTEGNETIDEFENKDKFFKRSSVRAVSFVSLTASASPLGSLKSKPGFSARSSSSTNSQNEDRLRLSEDNDADPKGKRPILQRLRSFEREPPFISLRPGKDTSSRKSIKSPTSSSPVSAEKFVLTITDTGGDAEHHEIYPIHPAESSSKQQSSTGSKEHRPRIFRRVSDITPQAWAKDKSLLQHVWGRGASPSKSIKIAKQFAEKVGETSIVKSMNHRQSDVSLPISDDYSEGLSPPQSIQFSPTSPERNDSEMFAQPLDARPQKFSKKEKREVSLDSDISNTVQLESSTAKKLMLDDFGMDHFVEPSSRRRRPTDKEKQIIDRALESVNGFSSGGTRVVYIRNWEQVGEDRAVEREEPWDFDVLLLRNMEHL